MQKLNTVADIETIISELSLEEKLSLLVGGKGFASYAIDERNIVEMTMCDSHNGINLMQRMVDIIQMVMMKSSTPDSAQQSKDQTIAYLFNIGRVMGGPSGMERLLQSNISNQEFAEMDKDTEEFARKFITILPTVLPEGKCPVAYPVGMNMAATWNRKFLEKAGQCVGAEAVANDVDILLAPTLNILRDPLCGRWFEGYSEDPYLTSEIVKPYIRGVEFTGTLATPKHYACNNQETLRHEIDEIIPERALREIYLPGFEAAVSKSSALMTAYNSVNGDFCSENAYLLDDILRKEWNFDGLVISDWNGVYDKVKALKAGNNLEMPGPNSQSEIEEALKSGDITIEVIDKNVKIVLEAVVKSNRFNKKHVTHFDYESHKEFSKEMADESLVLLKNEQALPIKSKTITVLGDYAKQTLSCGEGSSGIISQYVISINEGLSKDYVIVDDISVYPIVLVIGETVGEGSDRKTMQLDDKSKQLIKDTIKGKKGNKLTVLLNTPGPVDISEWMDDIDGLVFVGYPGQEVGRSVADLISGKINPSAKLTFTYPKSYMQTPTCLNFPGEFRKAYYGEGIYVGYRYYDKKEITPLFEFGFGLSYTSFEYSNVKLNKELLDLEIDQELIVNVDVTNTGTLAGKEVVQLYLQDVESTLDQPIKELKGFEKVKLNPSETKTVQLKLKARAFMSYDVSMRKWTVEPGVFKLLIGSSSREILVEKDVEVVCHNPYGISLSTPISELMKDAEMIKNLKDVLPDGFFELPGIQIELIYHPELSLEECIEKHGKQSLALTDKAVDTYKEKVLEVLIKK